MRFGGVPVGVLPDPHSFVPIRAPMEREPAPSVFALTPLFPCAACLLRSAAALRFPVLANQYNQSNAPLTGTHFFACLSQYRRSCCHSTEPQKGGSGREPLRERLQPSRQPDVLFLHKRRSKKAGRCFSAKKNGAKRTLLRHGVPGRIRTSGLWSRSPTLYPAELRVPVRFFTSVLAPDFKIQAERTPRP